MPQFHYGFYCFFLFFGSDFFLKRFPNPFRVHSRPSISFELNFHFSLVFFLFTCGILTLIFGFLFRFLFDFFWNGSPNSPIVCSRSSFCLLNENTLNCTQGLVLLCFFTSSDKNFSLYFILPPLHFAWNLFDFSRLVSLFSHSAKSVFRH